MGKNPNLILRYSHFRECFINLLTFSITTEEETRSYCNDLFGDNRKFIDELVKRINFKPHRQKPLRAPNNAPRAREEPKVTSAADLGNFKHIYVYVESLYLKVYLVDSIDFC